MKELLLPALGSGATLVTANRRLQRQWRADFDAAQQAAGLRAWPTPSIFSWDDWLLRAHEESFTPRRLLSEFAERYIWERIIPSDVLLDRQSTAEMASKAWALLRGWNISLGDPAFFETKDTEAFAAWALDFTKQSEREGWQSAATLADSLDPVAAELWLTGFDELTPQQKSLLARRGAPYFTADGPANPAGDAVVVVHLDAVAELRAAATWAREEIEDRGATFVGIVVQDLAARRHMVETIFRETLGGDSFNISLGRPLADYPIVATALQLLKFALGPSSLSEVGQLLLSPFLLGGETEYRARAVLDARLRRQKRTRVLASELQSPDCPRLAEALKSVCLPEVDQSLSAWVTTFLNLLHGAGWPGERTLNSEERQAERRLHKALCSYSELDPVTGRLGPAAAVRLLERLLNHEVFQPESATLPVQILESLQAAGAHFDALWVQGVDDRNWPAAARPNPFLPYRLQRELRLPHSSAEREMEFSRNILERLRRSAPRVVFSYAQREDETKLRPSRLISHIPQRSLALKHYPTWAEIMHSEAELESFEDDQGPMLSAGTAIRAGTHAIKWQAQCPFQGFARTQLEVEPLESPEDGIDRREQGQMLHTALELFWQECKDHSTLVSSDCTPLLERAVDEAVNKLAGSLRQLERERLIGLLGEWLEEERKRDPFRVETRERVLRCDFAGLRFQIKPDRIDRVEAGGTVIIDYKSGSISPKKWDGARPDEPQLPIYAVAADPTPSEVAFAQVRRGECKWIAAPVPMEDWRRVIEALAQELRDGLASVTPKDDGEPCEYCHLHTLCRVAEVSNA